MMDGLLFGFGGGRAFWFLGGVWIYVSGALTFRELWFVFSSLTSTKYINCACNDTNHIHDSPGLLPFLSEISKRGGKWKIQEMQGEIKSCKGKSI